ncbi:hypothetical protein BD408DRAFT_200946 [Parasitella parasitica]|nr:hypothetical protein BD408DRAFT_200946 [Parasitella parasitica]
MKCHQLILKYLCCCCIHSAHLLPSTYLHISDMRTCITASAHQGTSIRNSQP